MHGPNLSIIYSNSIQCWTCSRPFFDLSVAANEVIKQELDRKLKDIRMENECMEYERQERNQRNH